MPWNCELPHPLMFVRDLDAPARRPPGCSARQNRGRRRAAKRGNLNVRRKPAPTTSCDRVTRSQSRKDKIFDLVVGNVALSESDSEEEELHVKRKRSASLPPSLDDMYSNSTQNIRNSSEKARQTNDIDLNDSNCQLLADLDLSSDSSSLSSSGSPSEITGPSDSESSHGAVKAEPLAGNWIGEAYFWISSSPDSSVYENFVKTSLDGDREQAISQFQIFCRDYPKEYAGQLFAEKLRGFAFKKCVNLLRDYFPLFERKFFSAEVSSREFFGGIVMTLVHHWYNQKVYQHAAKVLKFMDSVHIDPLSCRPFVKIPNRSIPTAVPSGNDIVVMCCEIFFGCDDFKRCVRLLLRALSTLVLMNDAVGLDCVRPLLGRLFSKLNAMKNVLPLLRLFSGILDIQEELHYPVDLSVFFDNVLCALVSSDDRHSQSLALDLFEKVNYLDYCEVSGVACRGLLIVSALQNQPRRRLQKIFSMCVNKGEYPPFNLRDLAVNVYSSMTTIEIQIYLERLFFAYAVEIRNKTLQLCDTVLTFHVIVVSSASVRDYVYPVHSKIRQVDHSLAAALGRLKSVLFYYLKVPVDSVCQRRDECTFIMFVNVAKELFKKVLATGSTSSENSCIISPFSPLIMLLEHFKL